MTPSPTPQRLTPERLREIADDVEHRYSAWTATIADELRAHAAYLETQQEAQSALEWADEHLASLEVLRDIAGNRVEIVFRENPAVMKYSCSYGKTVLEALQSGKF